VRYWVAVTDTDWYRFLSVREDLDEVNFWQPSARRAAVHLPLGAPFLFKLHASDGGWIVGGGFVARYDRVPVDLAWEAFEEKNGAFTRDEMIRRIQRYRRMVISPAHDEIGCWILRSPFFLSEDRWVKPPEDWAPNIVQGKGYDDSAGVGARVWGDVNARYQASLPHLVTERRYGTPTLVTPRLGQGEFRLAVTAAYSRRCAMTAERVLPALEAAHIRPYSEAGEHRLDNGLLLRRDVHALFDRGYITVRSDFSIEVSPKVHDEWENGRAYYSLSGRRLDLPADTAAWPNPAFLEWHAETRYLR